MLALIHADVVSTYAYGESQDRLDRSDWGPEYHDAVVEAGSLGRLMKQMFWIFVAVESLPESIQSKLSPSLALAIGLQRVRSRCR